MRKKLFLVGLLVLMISLSALGGAFALETKASSKIKLVNSSVPAGMAVKLDIQIEGETQLPADLVVKSKNTKIAKVAYNEAESAWTVEGIKAGKATISVSSTSLGASATCKVTVKKNTYTDNKKPLKGDGAKELIPSIKKLYFKSGNFYVDFFLYNATGTTVKNPSDITVTVYNDSGEVLGTYQRDKKIKRTLGKKKHMVFTAKVPCTAAFGAGYYLQEDRNKLGVSIQFKYLVRVKDASAVEKSMKINVQDVPWA